MEQRKRVPLVCMAVVFATACASGGTDGGSPTEKLDALERNGVLPTLDRTDSLAGIDNNNDGIRDDIEAYIASTYPDPAQQAAVRQHAAVLQAEMLVDKNDRAALRKLGIRGMHSVHCLFSRFGEGREGGVHPAAVSARIESITANTKPRLLAYLAYSDAMDGTTGTMPEGDTCE